ncbi:N-acetylglucosamine-1-phosphodiester alpha-N-acetylglucosaminidase [Syngnathus acus]|uniref:N-acetylglucosamine-1-phosphodiester alpha-N-acetylglucosaminidase n=1 Tax=Syngnathus acus TaxID=161584 RepID=UPI00188621E4|nr:N-acetylglucosamine-1-phosphodiester alpha-N-acetylglucosaminidase [Syngnathus acus]
MAPGQISVRRLWLFLCFCCRLWTSRSPGNGVWALDDTPVAHMSIPQPNSDGLGPHHSRFSDCQAIVHGNLTHENIRASNHSGLPLAESRLVTYELPGRVGTAHFTVVHDPLRTLSVLEPGRPGGCANYTLSTVEATSRAPGCLYAQNGGFFDTRTGQCLGNVVSDGRMVQDSGGVQNALFGMRRDGTLVFGYLSEEEVLDASNPFVQLVSGVMWLLRNGEVYVNSSLKAECKGTQETGSLQYFTDVISARTALGHDAEGRVVLVQIDGQTGERGMNLWEMADFLKENGVINAINMDGGGSSTFVSNGILASYPSDKCKANTRWRCARAVSTVLCVHPRRCRPADCGGHGICEDGVCRCQEGWRGAGCESAVCQPPFCGPHGVCTAGGCVCDAGWRGKNCSQECLAGFYGNGCNLTCICMNGGSCHHVHGGCSCMPGFSGATCEEGGRSQDKEQERETYLTEATWLTLTIILSILLLLSLLAVVALLRRPSRVSRTRANYTYLPLTTSDGEVSNGRTADKCDRDCSNSLEII